MGLGFSSLKRVAFPRGIRQGFLSAGLFFGIVVAVVVFVAPHMLAYESRGAFFPVILYIAIAFTLLYVLGFVVTATFPKYNIWIASFIYLVMWASTLGWAIWLVYIALV